MRKLSRALVNLAREFGLSEGAVILECGAGPFLECEPLIGDATKVILIDPVPLFLRRHSEAHGPVIEGHQFAVSREGGEELFAVPKSARRGRMVGGSGGGFLHGTESPSSMTPRRRSDSWPRRMTKVAPLWTVDPGNIDIAIIDTEGHEMAVLETMKSRPRILSVEVFKKLESNPLVSGWMGREGYTLRTILDVNHVYVRSNE
jgi:hypothetical protein